MTKKNHIAGLFTLIDPAVSESESTDWIYVRKKNSLNWCWIVSWHQWKEGWVNFGLQVLSLWELNGKFPLTTKVKIITKVFFTFRYTKTNNCPHFFAIWSKPHYWVGPKIIMLGYSDLVSVNDYHQKAQFSGFKGYKVNLKDRYSISLLNAYKLGHAMWFGPTQ